MTYSIQFTVVYSFSRYPFYRVWYSYLFELFYRSMSYLETVAFIFLPAVSLVSVLFHRIVIGLVSQLF